MSALAGGSCAGGSAKENAELKKLAKENGEDMNHGFPLSSLDQPKDIRLAKELHRRARVFYLVMNLVFFGALAAIFVSLGVTGVIHSGMVSGAAFIVGMVFTGLTVLLVLTHFTTVVLFATPSKKLLFSPDNWGKIAANKKANAEIELEAGSSTNEADIAASSKRNKVKVFPTSRTSICSLVA